ncbi:hypothetical protein F441_17718 [Phytophthora nicotianae CJ01A1]|uniref:RxLR effector protein n=6 Tax=Phytophthora nicotianae TaxID=4792 RepID=W2R023_PHYN3|nr:hypothetical protein PPTG_04235 [Phytophthora nicotianae INRA-310]ETI35860.1 hypothetical protein F443_17844 [Phytophthora nicotianae P1569]ETK76166.1 hypothetical protein L915_17368 [Phytophthora nicotianae]ETO64574.1 hypothetical protein F444_17881 [Phytophthora nicotianae P1976]ETP05745.1 hypothetical protein F441_17718 [Phytophthora nicotianae CJ01A1]ETP33801.1 hypothetical protein F442_17699 [Phytophthora nicotianae P10297]
MMRFYELILSCLLISSIGASTWNGAWKRAEMVESLQRTGGVEEPKSSNPKGIAEISDRFLKTQGKSDDDSDDDKDDDDDDDSDDDKDSDDDNDDSDDDNDDSC